MVLREVVGSSELRKLTDRTEGRLLVVKFTATWCGPCRQVAPQYEALAQRTPDVEFVKVYDHNSRDAIVSAGVRSFPTFRFYCHGAMLDECRGANIQAVEQRVNMHRAKGSVPTAPVMIKLKFDSERPRKSGEGSITVTEEVELEVYPSEGLEILKFQVLSVTGIDRDEQVLTSSEANVPVDSDASLAEALRRTGGGLYGNYPVMKVARSPSPAVSVSAQFAASTSRATVSDGVGKAASASDWDKCCSRILFGAEPVVQPAYVIREETLLPKSKLTDLQVKGVGPESILTVCKACAEACFVPGRAKLSPGITSSIAFVCQSKGACAKGYGSDLFSQRADAGFEVLPPGSSALSAAKAMVAAAAESMVTTPTTENPQMVAMRRRVRNAMGSVLAYEDSALQAKAWATLASEGADNIRSRGQEIAADKGISEEEGLALALLSWFKKDFFKWTTKPACSGCGARGDVMEPRGVAPPTPEEVSGKASAVEVYICKTCGAHTRFPRYNDPGRLLETRNGRCGEWANCFTLLCRAVNLEARHVVDWTDHVWTEIWIPKRRRWVHADPCENKLDRPLMYEQGWNKRLSYILAFDRDGAVDVTRRYSRRWMQALSRRDLVPEKWLVAMLQSVGATLASTRMPMIAGRLIEEQEELKSYETKSHESDDLNSEEKEGRQSGDAEWVESRGEGGVGCSSQVTNATVWSSSQPSCPLIGAPMGVLRDGDVLALSIGATVADKDERVRAKVSVGGVTVSEVVGYRVVCAAAVSGRRGILLDSRSFALHDGNAASAVIEWVANLTDGAIVAFAGTGWGTEVSADEFVSVWADITRMLVSNGVTGNATEVATSDSTVEDGFSWTLVGQKGAGGQQKWARCKRGNSSKSTHCALYLELVMSASPLLFQKDAVGASAGTPAQVELKDRLCVTPLRSVMPSATPTATAAAESGASSSSTPESQKSILFSDASGVRGTCFRSDEPVVAIGPDVDLVKCKGWTSVIQTPAASRNEGDEPITAPQVAWRAVTKSAAVGRWHGDTESFDDTVVGCPAFVMGSSPVPIPPGVLFLPTARVHEIVGWSGEHLNGVQVVYDIEGVLVPGPKHLGEHDLYRQSSIVLDVNAGEVVNEVALRSGMLVDSLTIRTNKGREKTWGGGGGDTSELFHASPGYAFVAFHGGLGGHLHSLGVTFVEQGGDEDAHLKSGEAESLAAPQERANLSSYNQRSFLSADVVSNLYSPDPVRRACAQILASNTTTPTMEGIEGIAAGEVSVGGGSKTIEGVMIALETARQYADNLLASPLDPRVSSIRLGNGFFDRKIGRLAGGGRLMRAMGFRLSDKGGVMYYVFERAGAGGGMKLDELRRTRQTLTDVLGELKESNA